MATFKKADTAQYVLSVEKEILWSDVVTDIDTGASSALGLSGSVNFDLTGALPYGAVVVGGDIVVDPVFVSGGAGALTVSVGDPASAGRYANAVSVLAAARTALTVTGFRYAVATELMATVISTLVSPLTSGKAIVRIEYVVEDRASVNL
jgi:hypothetical protein